MTVSSSERSKGTHIGRWTFNTEDVKVHKVLVSMHIVLQIHFRLLLAQLYSIWLIIIEYFMFLVEQLQI